MTTTDLEEVAHYYEALIPGWFPSGHMPDLLSIPIDGDQLPADAVAMANFQHPQERNPHAQMRALLFIFAGSEVTEPEPTAAEMVVACAMLLSTDNDCGPSYPVADLQFVPNAGESVEGQRIFAPFIETGLQPTGEETEQIENDLAELQALTQQKLDNFMALSDAEKEAWLDENWDRLSSGELTLDDMP